MKSVTYPLDEYILLLLLVLPSILAGPNSARLFQSKSGLSDD